MSKLRYLENVSTLELDQEKCIGCGMCAAVCPHGVFEVDERKAQVVDLDACIECGLCNQVCPSNIDLLRHFSRGRLAVKAQEENRAEAQAAKARFDKHQARMLAREAERESRRRHRLDESGDRPWLR